MSYIITFFLVFTVTILLSIFFLHFRYWVLENAYELYFKAMNVIEFIQSTYYYNKRLFLLNLKILRAIKLKEVYLGISEADSDTLGYFIFSMINRFIYNQIKLFVETFIKKRLVVQYN